jgi:hypothetical protein
VRFAILPTRAAFAVRLVRDDLLQALAKNAGIAGETQVLRGNFKKRSRNEFVSQAFILQLFAALFGSSIKELARHLLTLIINKPSNCD